MSVILQEMLNKLRTASNLLGEVAHTDLTGLNDEQKKKEIKENIEDARPQTAKKRGNGEAGNVPNKKPREEPAERIVFGHPAFIEELAILPFEEKYTIDVFLSKMLADPNPKRKEALTTGLLLVMQGVEGNGKEFYDALKSFGTTALVQRALSLPMKLIESLRADHMVGLYLGTSPGEDSSVEVKGTIYVLQNAQVSLGALRFILGWNELSKREKPTIEKNAVRKAIFRKKYGMEEDEVVERDSDDWMKFYNQFKDYLRAASRLLFAYKHLGSLVIFCPLLAFRYFHDGKLGSHLHDLIKQLATTFENQRALFEEREVAHDCLLRTLLNMYETESKLVKVLDDLVKVSHENNGVDID